MNRSFKSALLTGLTGLSVLAGGYQLQAAEGVEVPELSGEIIRSYLLKNPEILIEMQVALQEKQAAEAAANTIKVIEENKQALFNSSHDAVFGNPDGDITIVEFFDYNCGYCKRALPDMEAILAADPNVRFVMKEFPILGPDSVRAHIVSQAFKLLMPEKYQDLHIALMQAEGRSTEESTIAEAVKLGANEAELREKIKDPSLQASFQEAYQLANALNITGTPSYIIGNELVPGAIGKDGLMEIIAEQRGK